MGKSCNESEQIARNNNLKKNISLSFVYKFISMGLNFLLVPVLIRYLDSVQYGIWLTLLSMLSWVSFTDIGLGNGLRNKLTEVYANKNYKVAREYIATTYAFLSAIILVVFVIFIIAIPNLNWQKIFNTSAINNSKLILLCVLVTIFFLSNFVLALYNQLFYAVQKAAFTGMGQIFINLFYLICLILLKFFTKPNIIFVSVSYGISLILPSIILTYVFFKRYKFLKPKLRDIKINKAKDLLGLGIKFFIIQFAVVIYFGTNNLIITQIKGPSDVGVYDTAYKLFNTIIIMFNMLLSPLWSAFTEAYSKGDILWIKNIVRKLNLLLIPEAIVLLIIVAFSKIIFKIWIGNKLNIPMNLIILNAIYVLVYCWSNIYTYLMNGLNKLNMQLAISIFTCIVNIPLCYYFGKTMDMGISGIMFAQIITALPGAIILPMSSLKFLKGHTLEVENVKQD